jgi:hypothetical protein
VNVSVLAALVAERPGELCAAVQAVLLVRMPVGFAGVGLDRAAQYASRHRVRDCFQFAHA